MRVEFWVKCPGRFQKPAKDLLLIKGRKKRREREKSAMVMQLWSLAVRPLQADDLNAGGGANGSTGQQLNQLCEADWRNSWCVQKFKKNKEMRCVSPGVRNEARSCIKVVGIWREKMTGRRV